MCSPISCKYRVENSPDHHLLRVLGIRPGIELLVQSRQPLDGPVVVRLASRSIAIASQLAQEISIREVV